MNDLKIGAQQMGISLTDEAERRFHQYFELLEQKNKVMNLTAISGEKDIAELHFLDSLALLCCIDIKNKHIIDIGSGAGFPGLPLRIVEPTVRLTLLDAQRKRVDFLRELCAKLDLSDVICTHARAEETALVPEFRESFDFALSRAVAKLNVLCELCLPFVKVGGCFVASKSVESDDELKEAAAAIKALGGTLEKKVDYEIAGGGVIHRAILIRKISKTPAGFPRRFSKIQSSPL